MQYMKLRCPNPSCRVLLAVPFETQGQQVRCGGCGELMLVPLTTLAANPARGRGNDESRRAAA